MNVGFTIIGASIEEHDRKNVSDFLLRTMIFPTKKMADNIVTSVIKGADVSVYGDNIDYSLVNSQPWRYRVISVTDGNYLVISAVDFKLELRYSGGIMILNPTECREVSHEDALSFSREVQQGFVKVIPGLDSYTSNWILRNGIWEDSGIWIDKEKWKY